MGYNVICLDVDEYKISQLQNGIIPIYEPGLSETVTRNVEKGLLSFSTDAEHALNHGDYIFIAVGTPPLADGGADTRFVFEVARTIGQVRDKDAVVIDKSTVPVGTADAVSEIIRSELEKRNISLSLPVVSNPEFLKEGNAVADFFQPDRIVIGSSDNDAIEKMKKLYEPFVAQGTPVITMSAKSAELTKYAANAMLATRISFMNELANLSAEIGADISDVEKGIGSDVRIGSSFLKAGVGFGGSCFPKDIAALMYTAQQTPGVTSHILSAVQAVNTAQQNLLVDQLKQRLGSLAGKNIAIWGLAFKPQTDDMREATSLTVIPGLLQEGAHVSAFDPIATETAQKALEGHSVTYVSDKYEALREADALLILTEWEEFTQPNFEFISDAMTQKLIFDGRNVLSGKDAQTHGFEYHSIGRAPLV
jgi:UDPglucose 6-dehydrogenase